MNMKYIAGLLLGLVAFFSHPAQSLAAEPTLEQTVEWLKERLPGHRSYGNLLVEKIRYEEGWLYIHEKSAGCVDITAMALGNLDANALSRLEKAEGNVVLLESIGKWPMRYSIICQGEAPLAGSTRSKLLGPFSSREMAIKIAKAFDHAARLSGGGQKDLF